MDLNYYEVVDDLSTLQGVSGIYGLSGCYVSDYNPLYIGSSVHVCRRVREHLRDLKSKKHYNGFLQYAWNKHSQDFKVLLFTPCLKSETLAVEQRYLDHWQPFSDIKGGFNVAKSSTAPNLQLSEAGREEVSKRSKSFWQDPGFRRKQAESRKGMNFAMKSLLPPLINTKTGEVFTNESGLRNFAREQKLFPSALCELIKGQRKSHKGFQLYTPSQN